MIVQYCATCIAEMLHNTKHRDSSVNIPLSPDCSDEAKWRIGGHSGTGLFTQLTRNRSFGDRSFHTIDCAGTDNKTKTK